MKNFVTKKMPNQESSPKATTFPIVFLQPDPAHPIDDDSCFEGAFAT